MSSRLPCRREQGGCSRRVGCSKCLKPGQWRKTSCPGRGFPISPKVRLDRRRRGSIGSSSSRCNASADLLLLIPRRHDGLWWVLLGVGSFRHKNSCRSPLCVRSTCNVSEKLATYAHVPDPRHVADCRHVGDIVGEAVLCVSILHFYI